MTAVKLKVAKVVCMEPSYCCLSSAPKINHAKRARFHEICFRSRLNPPRPAFLAGGRQVLQPLLTAEDIFTIKDHSAFARYAS